MRNAFKKYDDIVIDVIITGDKDYCYIMEAWIRPDKNIGWNISPGGTLPPNWKGRKRRQRDEEYKKKLSKSLSKALKGQKKAPRSDKHRVNMSKAKSRAIEMDGKPFESILSCSKHYGVYPCMIVRWIKKGRGKYIGPPHKKSAITLPPGSANLPSDSGKLVDISSASH